MIFFILFNSHKWLLKRLRYYTASLQENEGKTGPDHIISFVRLTDCHLIKLHTLRYFLYKMCPGDRAHLQLRIYKTSETWNKKHLQRNLDLTLPKDQMEKRKFNLLCLVEPDTFFFFARHETVSRRRLPPRIPRSPWCPHAHPTR